MTTIKNAENLRQYKSTFSLAVEQMLALASSTNWVKEVRTLTSNFRELHNDVLHYR